MKNGSVRIACLVAVAIMGRSAWAQIPAVPAVPAAPAVPGVPAAPAAPGFPAAGVPGGTPAAPNNIWSKIMMTPEQRAACKKRWCECGLSQMLGVLIRPMTFATGGLIKPCCPGPDQADPADLAKPADSADGAAARIKADEAEAKERRANVRYLGTVDCSRYPEAEMALINALRTDRNECVRLEAAIVLGSGCCCTKKTIEALRLTVEASDKDGNPKEISGRVRAAAEVSLYACQVVTEVTPEPPEVNPLLPPPPSPAPEGANVTAKTPRRIRPLPLPPAPESEISPAAAQLPPIVNPIARTPAVSGPTTRPATTSETQTLTPTGQRGLIDIFRRSMAGAEPPR